HMAGKAFGNLLFKLLSSQTLVTDRRFAAGGTGLQWGLLETAVVAEHGVALLVVRESQVAELAGFHMAARGAMDVGVETTAVEKKNALAAVAQCVAHGAFECLA